MPVSMLGEEQLPHGPLRDLTQAIHELYESAGMPAARRISDAIRRRDDLSDTVSHEAVRNILLGIHSRWSKVQCVTLQLAEWAIGKPDPASEEKKIHALWLAAERIHAKERAVGDCELESDPELVNTAHVSGHEKVRVIPEDDQTERQRDDHRPLISWRTQTGTLDVYDRQMAIQLIKDIRSFQ